MTWLAITLGVAALIGTVALSVVGYYAWKYRRLFP